MNQFEKNLRWVVLAALALALNGCSTLAGLAGMWKSTTDGGSRAVEVPDGAHRTPVNRARSGETALALAAPALAPGEALRAIASSAQGEAVVVSLIRTLTQIGDRTGLRVVDNGQPDVRVRIVPGEDPMDVLRQLAERAKCHIELDRDAGRLIWTQTEKLPGVWVLSRRPAVKFVGEPVAHGAFPNEPMKLTDAMRWLAPADFAVGFEGEIEPNIRVELKGARSWGEALESVARQTPYRLVFDWNRRIVFAQAVTAGAATNETTQRGVTQ